MQFIYLCMWIFLTPFRIYRLSEAEGVQVSVLEGDAEPDRRAGKVSKAGAVVPIDTGSFQVSLAPV